MLRSVTNCPNIQSFCNDCNNGNRHISIAVNHIEDAMDRLMSGLLQFLNGAKALMDNNGRIFTSRTMFITNASLSIQ